MSVRTERADDPEKHKHVQSAQTGMTDMRREAGAGRSFRGELGKRDGYSKGKKQVREESRYLSETDAGTDPVPGGAADEEPEADVEVLTDSEDLDGLNYLAGRDISEICRVAADAVREAHDERRHRLPGALAEPFRALPAIRDEYLAFFHRAGILDGILVLRHQVLVARLAHHRDPHLLHRHPSNSSICLHSTSYKDERHFSGQFPQSVRKVYTFSKVNIESILCRCIIIDKVYRKLHYVNQ